MSNETSRSGGERLFIDSNEFLFLDCWSGDPDRMKFCQINTALGAIASLILPIFMIGGFVGNSLTAYIYLWKLKPLTRQGVYFAVIALADNCNLLMSGFIWMFLAKGLPWISDAKYGFYIVNVSDAACRFMRYLESVFILIASVLFLMMVMDRCLSVYFPFRFQRVTAKSSLKACIIATVVCALLMIPIGVHFRWIEMGEYTVCYYVLSGWEYATFYAYMLLILNPPTLQFFIILIANGFLICKMRHIVSEQAELHAGQSDGKLTNTVICVVLSGIMLISSLPTVFGVLLDFFLNVAGVDVDPSTKKLIWSMMDIGRILVLFNESVNWIVLLWKSRQFRNAFLVIICRSAATAPGRQAGKISGQPQVETAVASGTQND